MANKICHDIRNSFIKNENLLINTLLRKSSFPGLNHYFHFDSARRLVHMEVDRKFLS